MRDQQEPSSSESIKGSSFWSDIRSAVAGTDMDFTEGPLGRAILILSIPMVLEMSMESLFGIVDVFFVSRLGADAVATVGLTEAMLTIVFSVAIGLSMATTAMVARRYGEKHLAAASKAAVQSIYLGVVISVPVMLAGLFMAPTLLRWLGASDGIIATGSGYGIWMLGGNLTIVLLFLNNAIFRGAGDAVSAMRALWLANIINILLDPCLLFGLGPFPELGLTGAAVATNIGRGFGVVYQFYLLFNGKGRIALRWKEFLPDWSIMSSLIRVSIGGIAQFVIAHASWLGLVRLISLFGSSALAGYTVALRIIIVAILPSWGMSGAAATLVGQSLGAGKPDRAEASVWLTARWNMLLLLAVAVVFIVFADPMIRFFSDDPEVIQFGIACLTLVSIGYPAYAWGMVLVQAFNGAGDTRTPTIINFFCYWFFQIPLAYLLAVPLGFGADGVFLAITIAESIISVVGVLVFRRGRWKEQRI